MNIAKEIIKRAFDNGFVVRVDDGDGEKLGYGSLEETWNAIEAVEAADVWISVRGSVGTNHEWMMVIPGLDDDETVSDHTAGGWIEGVWSGLMSL